MSGIIHVSEAASLALHTMTLLASEPDRVFSTKEIATSLSVSEAHLAKVMQRLGKVGLVRSVRGPKGGFLLGKKPEEISLLEVYESIDGPLGKSNCLFGTPVCGNQKCLMGDLLQSVNRQARDYFENTTLSQINDGNVENSRRDHVETA